MSRTPTLFALFGLAACTPFPQNAVITDTVDLSNNPFDARFVGVTEAPSSDVLTLLDAEEGLFTLEDGVLTSIASPEVLMRNGADLRPYTDVVAMEDGAYAVTVRNDGLRVDVATQTTTQHFCYLPGSMVDESASQLTQSVAWDPESDTLFAQPQTFLGNDVKGSQLGTYSGSAGGQPERWFELRNDSFLATGMAWDGDRLLLARGSTLYTYELGDRKPRAYANLSRLGVFDITGMALRENGRLALITGSELFEIDGWRP